MMTLSTGRRQTAIDSGLSTPFWSGMTPGKPVPQPQMRETPEGTVPQAVGRDPYENWGAVMETLLHGVSDEQQIAFLKLNRLLSKFLTALRAWDQCEQWEDVRQDVLMKLVKSFERGQLRESKAFVTYAQTITRHAFYDRLKAQRGTTVVEMAEVEAEVPLDEATTLTVRAALQNLPEEHQRAVHAVYVEGRTYEEAAVLTAIPLGSLKRYLRLGVARLREQLDGVLNVA